MKSEKIIHFSSGLVNEVSASMQKVNLFHVIWPLLLQTQSHLPWTVAVALTAAPAGDAAASGKPRAQLMGLSQLCRMLILPHRGFFGGREQLGIRPC